MSTSENLKKLLETPVSLEWPSPRGLGALRPRDGYPCALVYTLDEEELALVDRLAHLRNDRKERMGIRSKKFDSSKSEFEAHYQGILGELGACRALGLDSIDLTERLSGDGGVDLTLPTGLSLEIRYRTKRGWDFALNGASLDFFKSDIGVLVWPGVEPNSVELVGWTTRVHLAQMAKVKNFGYGDRLVLRYPSMLSIKKLLPLVRKRFA